MARPLEETLPHFCPGNRPHRSRIEFGDPPADLGHPRRLGVLVHARIQAGEQRFSEGRAVLGWERWHGELHSVTLRGKGPDDPAWQTGRNYQLFRALLEGNVKDPAQLRESIDSCLLCGECTSVCFSEVKVLLHRCTTTLT